MLNIFSISDLQTVSGATSGKVVSLQTFALGALTTAQKNSLGTLLGTFTAWQGSPNNVLQLTFTRVPGNPSQIVATATGVVVQADGNTAIAARSSLDDIVGVVP